ncbi:9468_t:CDS:1 [Dentiscutata heterogama]|uniref:9468_t:CDS:1 n=1 Tax=Dentiscutata heterogama TaxID=1316150 RepID=A0ACA9M7W9_9GLOM|nr:9468_t:CDS:1 [Dentiscutata heterogama]
MKDSSYETCRGVNREVSTCSPSRSSSRQPSSPRSRSSISRKDDLIFINISADDFSNETSRSSLSVRPDGQFMCSSLKYGFKMEVGALESSRPLNSPTKKKQSDGLKLIMTMLMAGARVRENFNPKYMSHTIQGLNKIEYVTLQTFNGQLIVHMYDFSYSPIKINERLVEVVNSIWPTLKVINQIYCQNKKNYVNV